MSGAEIARTSIRSSLVLFLGNFSSTAISAVAVIVVARLLGPEEYGVYALAFVTPGILQLFIGFGALTAATRYSAYYVSLEKLEEAKRYTVTAIIFIMLCGLGLSLGNFLFAGPLSRLVLHRSGIQSVVELASLYIIGTAVFQATMSSATGWNWADLASYTNVLQSVLRGVAAPLLLLAGFGVYGAIAGQVVTLLLAGTLGVTVLYLQRLRHDSGEPRDMLKRITEMIRYGFPAFSGNLMSGLATYYVTIIVALIANNSVVGAYQAAANFTAPVFLISSAAASSLFPAFASLDGAGGDTKTAFRLSMKLVGFFMIPVIFFMASSAGPIIGAFYGQSYSSSAAFLELLAVSQLPLALGSSVLYAFFNGLGRTRLTLYANLVGVFLLAATAPLLSVTLGLGVEGLIYALILSNAASIVTAALEASTQLKVSPDFKALALTSVVSAACSLAITLLPIKALPAVPALAVSALVFSGIYLTAAPALRAVNGSDIWNLKLALGKLRVVGGIISPILRYEASVIRLTGGN